MLEEWAGAWDGRLVVQDGRGWGGETGGEERGDGWEAEDILRRCEVKETGCWGWSGGNQRQNVEVVELEGLMSNGEQEAEDWGRGNGGWGRRGEEERAEAEMEGLGGMGGWEAEG